MSVVSILQEKDLTDYIDGLSPFSDGTMRKACELHGGDNPTSFAVFPDNSWYCFACGESGSSVIDYTMARDALTYDEAVQKLCEYYNLPLDKEYKEELANAKSMELRCKSFESHQGQVMEYLHKRGFTDGTIKQYRFGYNEKSHCLIIPLPNTFGRIIGFTARYLDGRMPKYKHSKTFKKSEYWFGLNIAKKMVHKKKHVYLVEGHIDQASITQMGEPCLAYLGVRPSKEQILLLKKHFAHFEDLEFILIPDADGIACGHIPQVRTMFSRWFPTANVRVLRIDKVGEGVKDANDLLVKGLNVTCLEDEGLDFFTMKFLIGQCNNVEQEYKTARKFVKTVSNEMVKADISDFLAKRWGKEPSDVKNFLNVNTDTKDELLKTHADIYSCMDDWNNLCESESSGLGFEGIDQSIDGIRSKECVVLAGYTSSGKSTLALKMICHRIIREGDNVIIFSLEMSRGSVIETIVCEILGINPYDLKEWRKDNEKNLEIYKALLDKIQGHLIVIDSGIHSVQDIIQHIKLANEFDFDKPCSFCLIDHFHLLNDVDDTAVCTEQANLLGESAKELNLTYLVLAQFSEYSQKFNGGKRPPLAVTNIKGGNALKAIAHIIILVEREYFRGDLSDIEREELKYISLVRIGKSRRGIRGATEFALEYNPQTTHMKEVPLPCFSDHE